MSFDEQPDAPLHGECAQEIKLLNERIAEVQRQSDGWQQTADLNMADYIKVEREREDTAMQLDAWKMSFAKEERAHEQTIIERDKAQEAVSEIYFRIIGDSPEWSNLFGYEHAIDEIMDAFDMLRAAAKADATPRIHELQREVAAHRNEAEKNAREDARSAAIEASWKERQGEEYGSY